MSEIKVAVVGVYGYGRHYINEMLENQNQYNARLTAVVDVSPKLNDEEEYFVANGIKTYSSLEELYAECEIDLTVLSSPIHLHLSQSVYAMNHGSHVLLEKPVAGCLKDTDEIIRVRDKTGKKILIGFQQIYDETIKKTKEIILDGSLGKLRKIKFMVLWPRKREYFARSSWAGKLEDSSGCKIRDSVANNATAHYYMTALYLAGKELNGVAGINYLKALLSRVNDIETFDTCIIEAKLEGGADMFAISSHAIKNQHNAVYEIEFENGKIVCEEEVWKVIEGGKEKIIGSSTHASFKKIWHMVKYIQDDNYPLTCTVESARKHVEMIEMLDAFPVESVDKNIIKEYNDVLYAEGLEEELIKEYTEY